MSSHVTASLDSRKPESARARDDLAGRQDLGCLPDARATAVPTARVACARCSCGGKGGDNPSRTGGNRQNGACRTPRDVLCHRAKQHQVAPAATVGAHDHQVALLFARQPNQLRSGPTGKDHLLIGIVVTNGARAADSDASACSDRAFQ